MKSTKSIPPTAVFVYRSILLVASMLFLLFVPSKGQNRILINQDPNRPEGFYCVDSTGKEIAYIPQSQQYDQSPYLKILLVPNKTDVDVPGMFKIYNTENLSAEKIKKGLNHTVKKMPEDSILEKSMIIIVSYNCWYDYHFQNYLVSMYSLTIYDENSEGIWVETVINVYDGTGRLVCDLTDYHSILEAIISSDGKYMLALQSFPMWGDGTGSIPVGMLLYNLEKPSCVGSIPNILGDYELINFDQGVFLFYAYINYDPLVSGDYIPVKVIVDPENHKAYVKSCRMPTIESENRDRLHLKSNESPDGEEIGTYTEILFSKQ
ncbi:MAG: hypothetical protein IT259_08170 [Saprospiraceae bacterium]|nr:hypothetical protein [Saprospiraceae bacterium]